LSENPDPFILSNSLVYEGSGLAVVCCVGENSRAYEQGDERIAMIELRTPLQERLEALASTFTKFGFYSAIVIFAAAFTNYTVMLFTDESAIFLSSETLYKSIEYSTLAIAIILVAAPEGLPLAIGLVLAYSTKDMKKDGILVRNLESPEQMAPTDIMIVGKTGTMTKGKMTCTDFYLMDRMLENKKKNSFFSITDIPFTQVQLAKDCIIFNSTSRIEMDDEAFFKPVGNQTECALFSLL